MSKARNLNRRGFLKLAGAFAFSSSVPSWARAHGVLVNDVHSQLNPTWVSKVIQVQSRESLQELIRHTRKEGKAISFCGSRHAGGGQQFASNSLLADMTRMNRVLNFDQEKGLLEVEAGIRWPELLLYLERAQQDRQHPWGISQKQTGGDHLTIGGALSANAHGQGLKLKPFISDVESFTLINSTGQELVCSRDSNKELFRTVIGGYGLFGVIHSITLRLVRRRKVQRIVEMIGIEELDGKVESCISRGYPYGDFQVNIDTQSKSYLQNGIFSGYQLVDQASLIAEEDHALSELEWFNFVLGAHVNKHETFEAYVKFFQSSNGHVNWSDVWQSGPYMLNYHRVIDRRLHEPQKATEILTEVYVPRKDLATFFEDVRADFIKNNVDLIYSTVRFIEQDNESFLPWAKNTYACVIFNLHTVHTPDGIEHAASALKRLIDLAIKYGGSYYLTYHKYASQEQVLTCYPQFPEFLKSKLNHDPDELFQSDWYRHYKQLFGVTVKP